MNALRLEEEFLQDEAARITAFIEEQTADVKDVVLGVSGGVDSDVTARLCIRALGANRIKCVTVLQNGLEPKYVENARFLAEELGLSLVELDLRGVSEDIFAKLARSDPGFGFRPEALSLDVGRGKCAIRSFVFSAYCEHGRLVVGPAVRTEYELGYFLPLGDGAAHICPLVHLYKSEVLALARILGTAERVRTQQPAAGFWEGDEDLTGIAVWLYHGGPVEAEIDFSPDDRRNVQLIRSKLTFRQIDQALIGLADEEATSVIAERSGLPGEIVDRIKSVRQRARERKCFPLRSQLLRRTDWDQRGVSGGQ